MASTKALPLTTTAAVSTGGKTAVIIPPEARQKYPDLVELIVASESMNAEERNYWLQVLPVMTKEQVEELRDILQTEKKKLAAIDAKYKTTKEDATPPLDPLEVERRRRAARTKRQQEEIRAQKLEETTEQELLGRLANL